MKFTVIYPPTIDYEIMQQRPQRLMEQFARQGHQVYYLNLKQRNQVPRKVMPNLIVLYRQEDIYHVEKAYPVILWTSWAMSHPWVDRLSPLLTIYDCLDDFPEWREIEPLMAAKADLVITTSQTLFEKMKSRHPHVLLVRNGCDFNHFASWPQAAAPGDWPSVPPGRHVAGYIGALARWVDHHLLERLADYCSIVLVGPEFGMPRLRHPEIYRLGHRPYIDLPGYIKKMDFLLIPFFLNSVTLATNPVKMYEYLATGKPVISTDLPEARIYSEVLSAASYDNFLAQVHRAMTGNLDSPEAVAARQRVARENTWAHRYETVYMALSNLAAEKISS